MSETGSRIYLFDTTLRDGAQTQGVDFSVSDKLVIARALDKLGVDYIEGGWPGANPTDDEFFSDSHDFERAQFVAFGMTHRHGVSASNDTGLSSLLNSSADSICIVGKSWDEQVSKVLGIDLADNVEMIGNSVSHLSFSLSGRGEAMYDAEHFFDGYKGNPEYAMKCLQAAKDGGARWLVLCDTRGGTMPHEVYAIASEVCERFGGDCIGIHAHNDTENAVANSLSAVAAGVRQVQGTINGLGERCGNANMISLIPNLTLKLGYETGVSADGMKSLLWVSRLLDERLGREPFSQSAYVGSSAFAHKGGLHVSAIAKDPTSYEHISPELVGNDRAVVMSNQAGMTNVKLHLRKLGLTDLTKSQLGDFLALIKEREFEGYSYDGADASFELLVREYLGDLPTFFEVLRFRVIDERRRNAVGEMINESEATVQVSVGGQNIMRVAMGIGPVHAFDSALRLALIEAFPELEQIELIDYKVRIMAQQSSGGVDSVSQPSSGTIGSVSQPSSGGVDAVSQQSTGTIGSVSQRSSGEIGSVSQQSTDRGTAALTRVLLESSDRDGNRWTTVGVSGNVIDASAIALYDSYAYRLFKSSRGTTGRA